MPPIQAIFIPTRMEYGKRHELQIVLDHLPSSPHQDIKPRRPLRKQSLDTSDHSSSQYSDTKPRRPVRHVSPTRRVSVDFVKSVLTSAKNDCIPIMPLRGAGVVGNNSRQRRHTCYHAAAIQDTCSLKGLILENNCRQVRMEVAMVSDKHMASTTSSYFCPREV
ncbi:hypothetical protein MPSEU_000037600 [Mayamaea pseudoterrestris]|nr:hypothetical protein MPSEU_000037600 [Mayamaea pseudoterrestris]